MKPVKNISFQWQKLKEKPKEKLKTQEKTQNSRKKLKTLAIGFPALMKTINRR